VSKLLVDLQIENTNVKEQGLTEKYELEARILAMESEVVDREEAEQKRRDELAHLHKQIEVIIKLLAAPAVLLLVLR